MKIRSDFVTNSSSSSFIVSFETIPKTQEELKRMLFGDEEYYYEFSTSNISKIVFNDLKAGNINLSDLVDELSECSLDELQGMPDMYDYPDNESFLMAAVVFLTPFINEKFKSLDNVFKFEYGDEDGPLYSALEHGNLFKNLYHIKISHH